MAASLAWLQQCATRLGSMIKQRPMRTAWLAGIVGLLLLYMVPYKQTDMLPVLMPLRQSCFATYREQHLQTLSEEPLSVEQHNLLPFVGNGVVMASIASPLLYLLPSSLTDTHIHQLAWRNHARLAAQVLHQETFVETASGALVQLTEYRTSQGNCMLVESRYFALRRNADVFVQQLRVDNTLAQSQTVMLQVAQASDEKAVRLSLPEAASETSTRVRAVLDQTNDKQHVLVTYTLPPVNLTLTAQSKQIITIVTSLQPVSDSLASDLLRPQPSENATAYLLRHVQRVTQLSLPHSEVFERHETLHHALFPSHLQAVGANPETQRLAFAMKASVYYLTSLLEVAELTMDETESLHDRLTSGSKQGCYDDKPLYTSQRWTMPTGMTDVVAWRNTWLNHLHDHGCLSLRSQGRYRSVDAAQAFLRAIVGLNGRDDAYRIAPPWLMPEGLTVQLYHMDFDRNLLNLDLSRTGLTITRADRLRESLVVQVGRDTERLGAHGKLDLPAFTTYLGLDAANIEAMFDKHQDLLLFGHAPTDHRFSMVLVLLLAGAVLCFHAVLAQLVYREFCSGAPSVRAASRDKDVV
eukprot:TRINITY_DN9742_c0_g1_i4.p1 TRINITY_DN9742_c0_g1~~TRINITY_DN9742_c0_g1_i4.p1  ORF type:complete len:628 (+),score=138.06 TRINITY_DN9742_c0_g1_i4:142-1884(+)